MMNFALVLCTNWYNYQKNPSHPFKKVSNQTELEQSIYANIN